MKKSSPAPIPLRSLLARFFLIAGGLTLTVRAQTTVAYNDGQVVTTARTTTPANPLTFTIAAGAARENGVVSGTGSLTKTGAGTLSLGATNTYSGGTFLNAGTLGLAGDNALGTGAITITGGGLRAEGAARNLTNALFTSGTFTVGRSTTFSGATTLNAATTIIASNPDGVANADTTFSGAISGNFGVTLAEGSGGLGIGSGSIVFSGTNTYTGGTTLRTRLSIASDAALGAASGALTLDGGTLRATASFSSARNVTLSAGGGAFDLTGNSSFTGTISGSGSLAKVGTGTLTLSGANTYSGGTTISAGQITLGSAAALGTGTIAVASGATLNAGAYDLDLGQLAGTGQVGTSGNLVFSSGTVTNTNSLSGTNLVVNGGELTLAGSLSLGSRTDLNGGVLNIASSVAMAATGTLGYNFRGGTLRYLVSGNVNMPPQDTQVYADGVEQYIKVDVTAGNSVTWNGAQLAKFTPSFGLSRVDFTKLGAGTLKLFGGNLYTQAGSFRIAEGSLILQIVDLGNVNASYDYGTGRYPTNIVNNGNLTLQGFSSTYWFSYDLWGVISGIGSLTTAPYATVNLYNRNTYTGATTVGADTAMHVWTTDAIGVASAVTVNGTLNLHGNTQTVGSIGGTGTVDLGTRGVFTAGGNDTSTTFSGTMTGGSMVTKAGEGTLTLSGNNSAFTGAITLEGGALALGSATAIGDSSTGGAISFNGGTLRYSASNNLDYSARFTSAAGQAFNFDTNGVDVTLSRALVSAGGTLSKSGAGTLTLAAANTYSGATAISGGTLALGASNSLANSSNVTITNATFALGAYHETVGAVSLTDGAITGTGTLTSSGGYTMASGTISASLAGPSSLQKTGSGNLSLSGDNTYTGGTTLGGGTVTLSSNTALGTGAVNLAGGTLQASGVRTVANALSLTGDTTFTGNFTLTGNLMLTSLRELTITNTTTLAGVISGSKTLFKSGAGEMVLTGANTYTGGTTITEGTVRINNTTGSAFGTGAVTVASGTTLTGAGSFTGALQLNGTYSPGNSPGEQSTGSQTWNGGGEYLWEINNATGVAGTHYDLLSISGSLTINATVENKFTLSLVSLLANDTAGDVINFDAAFDSSYTIAATTGGIFGFDASAFTISTASFANATAGGTWSLALTNSNRDLALNFTAAAIPEPSTYAALFGAGALALALYRRRRRATR